MAAVTTLEIGGQNVNLRRVVLGRLSAFVKDGIPSLTFYQRGGPLPGLPDPWLGKAVVLRIDNQIYFQGDVSSALPHHDHTLGWVVAYQCLGLRFRGNTIPYTDENTGTDSTSFNLQPDDPTYIASFAGRSVGDIIKMSLRMPTNAENLRLRGLGNFTVETDGTYSLPSDTEADVAGMTVIPPYPVYLGGQKLVAAYDAFLQSQAPNYTLWIDPATGSFRFLDMRQFGGQGYSTSGCVTLTMDSDPIVPTGLSRDTTDCYQRVQVRGQPWIEPVLLSTKTGSLMPDWTGAQQNAWSPSNFNQPTLSGGQDVGTAVCVDTLTVKCTTTSATSVSVDYWDQTTTGAHGIITLQATGGVGLTVGVTRRIVSNTATSGGVTTVKVDLPLPTTSFDRYTIFGQQTSGLGAVWRRYRVSDHGVGKALQNSFPYPVAYVGSGGASASLTSVPIGSVLWSSNGNPPYNQFPLPFSQTVDPTGADSYFLFVIPTYEVANNSVPAEVQVLAAVATGANHAFAPPNTGASPIRMPPTDPTWHEGDAAYAGTSHTVEGLTRTLVLMVDAWRDPANVDAMYAYAADVLDSVKDSIVEGEITILCSTSSRLLTYLPLLLMGNSVEVTGNGYETGWENSANLTSFGRGLQVISATLQWTVNGAIPWIIHLHCSNRRAFNTAQMFLRPDRIGLTWAAMQFSQAGIPGLGIIQTPQEFGLGDASESLGGAAWGAWRTALGPLSGLQGAAVSGMNELAARGLGAVAEPAEAALAGMQAMAGSAMDMMSRPRSSEEVSAEGAIAAREALGRDLEFAKTLGMDVGGAAAQAAGLIQFPHDRRTVDEKVQDAIIRNADRDAFHRQRVENENLNRARDAHARATRLREMGSPGFVGYETADDVARRMGQIKQARGIPSEPEELPTFGGTSRLASEPAPGTVEPSATAVEAAIDQPFGPETLAPSVTQTVATQSTQPTGSVANQPNILSEGYVPATPQYTPSAPTPAPTLDDRPGLFSAYHNARPGGGLAQPWRNAKPGEGFAHALVTHSGAQRSPSSPGLFGQLSARWRENRRRSDEWLKGVLPQTWNDYGNYGSE